MAYGAYTYTGQGRPMAAKPALSPVHNADTGPVTAWTPPPAGTGQGFSDPQPVTPDMTARGIQRQPAWSYGHRGTPRTAQSMAPANGALDGQYGVRDVMQARAAYAHGDLATALLQTHQHNYSPQVEAGEGQGVDIASGLPGPTQSAQSVLHGSPGGQFSNGATGDFGPKGFRIGRVRRWAHRAYASPALGAMYSRNSLRGILPQTVATPYNQRALAGPMESGIESNSRFLGRQFTLPSMFTQPRSASDLAMAAQVPQGAQQPIIGTGVM